MYNLYLRQRSLVLPRGRLMSLTLVLALALAALLMSRPLVMPATAPLPDINLDSGKLPLSFVSNAGQTDPDVHFQVHDMGGTIFFTTGETVLALPATAQSPPTTLRLHFEGANPNSTVVGADLLPGIVNYFVGNDPALWRTNIPTYAGIIYQQLYPGIDLHYEGTSGQLKSTYIVASGANPSLIRWRHDGGTDVRVDEATGNLLIAASGSTLIEHAPIAWQEINGQRISVAARYVVAGSSVGFALSSYDPAYPLIIDPTLSYGTYLGGSNLEEVEGIALDSDGNMYITGTTSSADFPTANEVGGTCYTGDEVFVAKINAAGDTLLYSTYLGGSEDEEGNGIAVDGDGNAYITGATDSTDFPTQSPFQGSNGGVEDAFVIKLNASGSALVYSTYLGGSQPDDAEGIAVDGAGNAYITGSTFSADFPTQDPLQATHGGGWADAYVSKLNASGSALLYSTYLGGIASDSGAAIAVDGAGNAYVTGETISINFPTQSALQPMLAGYNDVFVAKLNDSGSTLLYSTFLGGSGNDYNYGVAVDSAGNAYVTGNTESPDFPTQNPLQGTSGGGSDAFVTKLQADGGALLYSTYLGGSGYDKGFAIAVNSSGQAYVTGDTFSPDFPTENSMQAYASGNGQTTDAFVAKLEADGSALVYSTYLGGCSGDYGTGIAVDGENAYVAGMTFSDDFPVSETPVQDTYGGNGDAFVVKLVGEESPAPPPGPNLRGSAKFVSQGTLAPGETLTYTILLYNSGTADATAKVVDQLPAEVDYVADSASSGGVYDAGKITWSNVDVPLGDQVLLTFQVTVAVVETPSLAVNTATITSDNDSFKRQASVLLVPVPTGGDVFPPVVNSLTIDGQDVLTDPAVTLYISASDDEAVTGMYLEEWLLVMAPVPHWALAQSSGWVPYQVEYPWTLESESGPHFVIAWVADAAGNVSHLNKNMLDFASLLLPGETVDEGGIVPYPVYFDAGEGVTATLTTISGDADLYVWYPGNFGPPNEASTNWGTDLDEVTFTTPIAGPYLFLVRGYEASTYNLSITPGGGPRAWSMAGVQTGENTLMASGSKTLTEEQVLRWSGIDPLAETSAPSPQPFVIYLPLIFR